MTAQTPTTVYQVPRVDGVYLVTWPGEAKDFAVHEWRIQGERYSRAAHRHVDLNVHLFTCRHPDCQDRPMSAPDCQHIKEVRRFQAAQESIR